MNISIEHGNEQTHMTICPVEGNSWDYLQNAVMNGIWNLKEFPITINCQILSHYGDFTVKLKEENIDESEWEQGSKTEKWKAIIHIFSWSII